MEKIFSLTIFISFGLHYFLKEKWMLYLLTFSLIGLLIETLRLRLKEQRKKENAEKK